MTELVRIKEKFQVTIPASVRKQTSIRAGDYLEVLKVPEGILLRPKRLVSADEPRKTILDFFHEDHGPGRSKAEIDAELNAQRDEW